MHGDAARDECARGLREIVGIVEELRIGALKHGATPITGEQAARLALHEE